MSVFANMYDFLIAPIREADQREGNQFLERYLLGPQQIWEETDQKIKDIPTLWSITECPDEYLKYLKWIVGWTSKLDHITRDLTYDELRRLISISGRLWKLRGTEDTVVDVMFFATGMRNRCWSWFDFRWVLPYVGPPDSVGWLSPMLFFGVNSLVGDTHDYDGTLVRVTCKTTGIYADRQVFWWVTANAIFTDDDLGQIGAPSTDPNDYEVRLVSPRGTELSEEHEGRDSWVVDLPDPTVAGADYESNLRIVDDGSLNRALVVNLMTDLLRATGEKWEISYLSFLDQFVVDGDDTQWTLPGATSHSVADGRLYFSTKEFLAAWAISPVVDNSEAMYFTRFRGGEVFNFIIHLVDESNYYYIEFEARVYTWIRIKKMTGATPGTLATYYPPFDRDATTWYGLRVTVADEYSGGSPIGKRITVYLDGDEALTYVDTSSPHASGGVGLGGNGDIEVDEVEVMGLPAESDYVDLNS